MQLGALGVQVNLDDLLRVVPSAACVGHEDGLVQAEDSDRDQIPDEEVRIDEGESQGCEEHAQEDVEHALLGILGADLDDLLGILGGGLRGVLVKLHVVLDELDGSVGTGRHGLHRGSGEPVDDRTTGDHAEQERSVGQTELVDLGSIRQALGEHHDDREDHRGGTDDGSPDEYRFGRGLEGVASAILGFQDVLGDVPPGCESVLLLDVLGGIRDLLDGRQLVDALGVVGDRAVGVDGRAHAKEAEGHQAEGEDSPLDLAHGSHVAQAGTGAGDEEGDAHEGDDDDAQPESGEITGNQTGQDVQGGAAFAGARDDLTDVPGVRRGEGLDELWDEGAGQGAAGDDDGQLPPHRPVAHRAEHPPGGEDGQQDRHDRGDPDQGAQRLLEVHLGDLAVAGLGDRVVDEVRNKGGDQHDDAYHEDPHQQLDLLGLVRDGSQHEGDEGDAGDAVGLESISGGANRVTRVVTGAVSDDAGVTGVVLLNVEGDLHEIGADVSNLGEDTAGDTQAGGSEGLTNGESDEARAGEVTGQHQHDEEHEGQLDADEDHADAHAGTHRDVEGFPWGATQRGVGSTGIGKGVDANAVPGDSERSCHADEAEQQDDEHLGAHMFQEQEVHDDDCRDEGPQQHEELGLLLEVGLAGFVDELGNLVHRLVDGQLLQLGVRHQTEQADDQTDPQQCGSGDVSDLLIERRQFQIGLTTTSLRFPVA